LTAPISARSIGGAGSCRDDDGTLSKNRWRALAHVGEGPEGMNNINRGAESVNLKNVKVGNKVKLQDNTETLSKLNSGNYKKIIDRCEMDAKLDIKCVVDESKKVKMKPPNETKKQAKLSSWKNKQNVRSQVDEKVKCFYVNARSVINKQAELELYIIEEKPDIVGITETWAVESISDSEISLEGYSMFRKDRILDKKQRGGGVLLYIRNSISAVEREDIHDINFPECIWCEIEIGGEKTLIGICYRAPDSSKIHDEALFKMIELVSKNKILIMGDFNFADLNWVKPETLDDSHLFMKCINDNFLVQCVEDCTRGKNVLDLVLTSEENMVENLTVGEPFGSSDHQIIRWDFISCKGPHRNLSEAVKSYDYFKADYDKIRDECKEIDWTRVMQEQNVELAWMAFKESLETLRDKRVPIRGLKNGKGKCKWVTKAVLRTRRAKMKAWNKLQHQKTERNLANYKHKLSIAVAACTRAKRNYEQKLASDVKNNSKSFFAYVRSKQRTKERVGPLKGSNGKVVVDDEETASLLNTYFGSVFTVEDKTNIPNLTQIFRGSDKYKGIVDFKISGGTVEKKLQELKVDKCPGLDGIHPKMLFELRKEVSEPLAALFNHSLETSMVPVDWKDAGVTPLFKKGKKSDVQNYRPVSMTSIVCKIMESIIKDKIVGHLERGDLIRDSQHGFTRGRSCLTNLLEFFEEVTLHLDEGKPFDIMYLDFSKAFDKVPHQRLFKKLWAHGISGQILEWIKNWLTGRRQKVGVNKVYSGWVDVISGVPQGSVLGPLLFLIYINDLDDGIDSKLVKFADDTKVGREVATVQDVEIMRDDLEKIFQWSLDWQMLFNADKCTVLHMGRNNKEVVYKMGANEIKKVTQEKDLGVIVDRTGKSSEQCVLAVKKANSILGMIKRNIKFKSKNIMIKLYKALVRPRLEYCVQFWSPFLRKDIDMMERVQKRATRLIEGFKDMSYEQRLAETDLITLEKRRVRGDLIEVFKIMKGFVKIDYRKFFEISTLGKTRGHSLKLVKNCCSGERRKQSFSQRVINGWNGLPQYVIDADSVNCFKNRLDKFDKYF
jgi:ribonucleases P/MRP protein subunit RPP40